MNRIFSFHGSDHKNGCTMLAQSVAELLAERLKTSSVLLIFLNGRRSTEFISEDTKTIDHFKNRLDSRMPIDEALLRGCRIKENLCVIGGLRNEMEHRRYHPETAHRLLEELKQRFDIIIADTGSEIDNGLALGCLLAGGKNCMVLTQNEASIARYEGHRSLYNKLAIQFDYFTINKYSAREPYSLKYISSRIGHTKNELIKVSMSGYGNQAEAEKRTLLDFEGDEYSADIMDLAATVAKDIGAGEIKTQRNSRLWRSFI